MRPARPLCGAFQRRGESSICGWCLHHLIDHTHLDSTVWSSAGPFVQVGHANDQRIPNPAYRPEVAA